MSEHIPTWLWPIFGLGSPVQEYLNRKIPERLRPLVLWGIAGAIVIAVILLTPLDWDAFNLQVALVYAALTTGWAMSNIVKPPLAISHTVVRSLLVVGVLGALAYGAHAYAQADSTVVDLVPGEADPSRIFTNLSGFLVAQGLSFLGAVLTRWFAKERGNVLNRK